MKIISFLILLLFTSIIFAQGDISEAKNLLLQQKTAEAELLLEKILEEKPGNEEAIMLLGDLSSFNKNWDAAIDFYQQLVEKEPGNAEYNFKYGGALGFKALNVPKLKAVIYVSDIKDHLEKAAKIDSRHIESRRALVELYMQLPIFLGGSQQKAERFASELKSISPVDYFLAKGFILSEDEGAEEAKPFFEKAFEVFEKVPEKKRRNNINYELGKAAGEYDIFPKKGLKFLTEYNQNYNYKNLHTPEYSYYRKAQIYANLGQKSEALKHINKALTLRANFKEAQEEKERIMEL